MLLFGIATSVELFHEKLPRSAIRCIRGNTFDVERAEESLERVFNASVSQSSTLRPGPALSSMLLERQRDHVQSVQAYVKALKVVRLLLTLHASTDHGQYAYMSHFYANPLSILLSDDPDLFDGLQLGHVEAIRNLPSFRR